MSEANLKTKPLHTFRMKNTFATTVLSVLDRAIGSPSRAWKYLSIRPARAEIDRLAQECAKLGSPQPAFTSHHISKANLEVDRLRQVIADARQGKPISESGASAEAPPPGTSSQPAVVSATAAAPSSTTPIMSNKPAMPEQVPVKIATPGRTTTPARTTPKPAVSADIAARRARVFAVWDFFAGDGAPERLTQRPILGVTLGPEDGLLEHDLERADYNIESAARVNRAYAKKLQAQRDASTSPAAMLEDVQTILSAALAKGLRIPGESVTGLPMPTHAQPLPPAHREKAQAMIDQFCAVLDGDEQAAISSTPAARAAMKFIEQETGKTYTVGATIKTRAQIDAEKYPHSNIPRL